MIRPVASRVELGTKTKTQLVAEKAVLTSLLTAVISAAGDDALADQAMPFCRSICRCDTAAGLLSLHPQAPILREGDWAVNSVRRRHVLMVRA